MRENAVRNGPIYGLVCSGGGVAGAYQVGVLKYIHEVFCRGGQSPFQVFAGVSCGALNSSFYACESFQAQVSRLQLESLWEKFHVPQYHQAIFRSLGTSFLRWFSQKEYGGRRRLWLWSLLNPKPMMDIIQEGYAREHLDRSFEVGSTLGVATAATEIISGFPCWFLEGPRARAWKRFHSIGLIDRLKPAHVAASCSVPLFFPPVRIGDHYFVDGSVKLERPFSAAISMGATRILSISTRPRVVDLPAVGKSFEPKSSTVIRFMIKVFTQDFSVSEAEQIRVANRFAQSIHLSGKEHGRNGQGANALFDEDFSLADYRPIEVKMMYPSRSPEELFKEFHAKQNFWNRRRFHLSFMFHREFIRQLIRLGYEEARVQHEELKQFFQGTNSMESAQVRSGNGERCVS